ncbi:DUF6868 family protein [Pseudomarimonas salicorniae]|uniref:DUF6868 domain-containing protein n=1 Tax=Pseudomarimonas salicorniae TaxID=2933270 RepID=A0ABT0GKA7_9GAMM|nr:hypothetical protein [Lysobacter sp. CAU 1642]MCK7594982.1 hypothetical protein [Lysobacter sp. CAU 1642]
MDTDFLFRFLLCSLAVNYAILVIWFLALVFFRDGIRALHGRWFRLSEPVFDALHYGGMGLFKIGVILFNLTPLIVLWWMEGG